MTRIKRIHDDGQRLPKLHGQVIGIFDNSEQLDHAVEMLVAEGFSEDDMKWLDGEEGIALIERVEQHYFADSESEIGKTCISALRDGKLVFSVKVANGDQAKKAALTAGKSGGHGCMHFGMFVNTQFN